MARDTDQFDFFVSYARADDANGWIRGFVAALLEEHRKFTGGRALAPFFDREAIRGLDDWQQRIHHGLAASRLFLAFISPRYFASEWCRREWRLWIDTEIAKHILSAGVAPIYIVEVPGLYSALGEQEVAHRVAGLCGLPTPHEAFIEAASPVVWAVRRRQLNDVRPFYRKGIEALHEADLRRVLASLARDLDERAEQVRRAAESETTVPPHNRCFTGRLEELLGLRETLKDDRAGVISGIHGLGGIGKTELAFTYAHAFAAAYPGGRFLVPCEGKTSLREAVLCLGDFYAFHERISDEERKTVESYFAAVAACLDERLARVGHILLVLDNVTDPALLTREDTDCLTALGPRLHLLATTRLPAPSGAGRQWLTLGELPEADALALVEKHRAFPNDAEREAARSIVRRLRGFALAVELVAAWLAAHPATTCAQLADGLGLEDLHTLAEDRDVELRRHNHERRLGAVLGPMLATLSPVERRTLEYAAFLPPDSVALPWLHSLVSRDFPELAQPGRRTAPWAECWQRLDRLAFFTRAEGEGESPRLVRVHRLVQDLIRRELCPSELAARQQAVDALVRDRAAALEKTTNWQEARWELEPFDALARLWDETGHTLAAWLLSGAGFFWHSLAEWPRAEARMRRALAVDEAILGPEHPEVARDLNNLAQLFQATNRHSQAEPLMWRVLALWERRFGAEHPATAASLNNLALLLKSTNRLLEAEPLYRRALAIWEKHLGANHPNVAVALSNVASLLQDTTRLAEAEPLYRRALAIDEGSLGPDHPNVARDLSSLALLLMNMDRLSEAEPLIRRALAVSEASLGPHHPDVARDLSNLAQLLQDTNRLAEAELLMRRALAIDEQAFGDGHPAVAMGFSNLAMLLKDTDRLSEAEPLMRRALAIDEASLGPDHPHVARDLHNLALVLRATNRLSQAEPLVGRVVEVLLKFTRSTGHEHPHLQDAIRNYAGLLAEMGRSEAEVLAQLNAVAAPFGVRFGG